MSCNGGNTTYRNGWKVGHGVVFNLDYLFSKPAKLLKIGEKGD